MAQVLPTIPLPPEARLVARSGGTEAVQLTVRTPAAPPDVERYYRGVLSKGQWKLVKDSRDPSGAVVLLAQQKGPPLWVRIRSADDGPGTLIDLAGAVVPPDSTQGAEQKADPTDTLSKPAKPPV
jgi:hypothetical protein